MIQRIGLPWLFACLFAVGCIQDDGTRWTPFKSLALMSLDDERELGMEFDRELELHFRLISDPIVTGFLHDLGQQVVATVEPQPFIYRFQIVEAPQLNAFAVPGGYIYFHTGTLLAATSVDELAAVMAHEVAHVNKRHLAHRRQERQLPGLLTQAALIAASVASQNAAPLITGMAINVAVDLHYSRADEAEADRLGAIYASRAGFDPAHAAHFFQRILDQQAAAPDSIPPYLFSHPDVAERITRIEERAKTLPPVGAPLPGTRERFRTMQARLAQLLDQKRLELPGPAAGEDPTRLDPELAGVDALIAAGEYDRALTLLTNLSLEAPNDPRIPFLIGDLLYARGRLEGAISAYRHTLELDSSRAMVFFRLGIAYRERADRHRAVFAFEQAAKRGNRSLAARAQWEVAKLTFGVIAESGFTDDDQTTPGTLPDQRAIEQYRSDATTLAWWGRVAGPILPRKDNLRITWRNPAGRRSESASPEDAGRVHITARTTLPSDRPGGMWTIEIWIDDHVAHRDSIYVDGISEAHLP